MFKCANCEHGKVFPERGKNRTLEYIHGRRFPISDDLEIPTCNKCGETYTTLEQQELLDIEHRILNEKWKSERVAQLLATLKDSGFSRRDMEMALGVEPNYLRHRVEGTKETSELSLRLLEVFAADTDHIVNYLPRTHPLRSDK